MVRGLTPCVVLALAGLLPALAAHAQTSSQSNTTSSNSRSASSSSARGGANTAQTMSSLGTTEWQEAGTSRDTSVRGEFVGSEASDVPEMLGETQTTGRGTRASQTQRRGATSRGGFQPGRTSQYGRSAAPQFRATLTLGFPYTPVVAGDVGGQVQTCLGRVPTFAGASTVHVSVKDNVVILEGTVARKSDVALASQMAALEPGVVKIDNRLTVAGEPPAPPAVTY